VTDIRTKPAYSRAEAARLLRVPCSTLQYWFRPQRRVENHRGYLNFLELLEGYIIQVLRSQHQIRFQKIGKAIDYLKKKTGKPYPLTTDGLLLQTDGTNLFIEELGRLISISQGGQQAMQDVLQAFLKRVEYGKDGLAQRFFPLTRDFRVDSPKYIVVDPNLNFGRPCLFGKGIATAMIASRFNAGENPAELAEDYGCDAKFIEEAIRAEINTPSIAA